MNIKPHLKKQLDHLPMLPGVYLMKDVSGDIIYVGKSKLLRNRVRSYFRGFETHAPKVQTMVVNIHDFEYVITDNEMEALILEANLIKKHQPRFNILLKDDKMYPYIVITTGERFPRVFMSRQPPAEGARVFGPYTSAEHVKTTLEILQKRFPIRECSRRITDRVERPCLNYHIGRCAGACNHKITDADYDVYIQHILKFLSGDKQDVIRSIEQQMNDAASKMAFEEAARYRDDIAALKALNVRQKALKMNGTNQDFIASYSEGDRACVMLFQVREGKLIGRESHVLLNAEASDAAAQLSAFLLQYYSGAEEVPKEIYIAEDVEGSAAYADWLSKRVGHRITITVPVRGEKRRTIELVQRNAQDYLQAQQNKIEREYAQHSRALSQLRVLLGHPENLPLERLEAFDISNTSGVYSVGSMVVYEGGKRKRNAYRRYRIRTVDGPNDYASMQEVIYRRYTRMLEEQRAATASGVSYTAVPDLILIDGGKGHVHAAVQVLEALNLNIPVAGMVKDAFHKTEDLWYEGMPLQLARHKEAFQLIYAIQEEVHRFAIEYHKGLRRKEMIASELEEISGIGERKRIALLKHFGDVESIRRASVDELTQVTGIYPSLAEAIYAFFHGSAQTETFPGVDSV